ncbi:MAG: metallophosphoesterase family protein [Paludibacter sp.]
MKRRFVLPFVLVLALNILAQQPKINDIRPPAVFNTAVSNHMYDIILARPTNTSITLSMLFYNDAQIKIVYGLTNTKMQETDFYSFEANKPQEIILKNLKPDALYFYHLKSKSGDIVSSENLHFHTQRSAASNFTFTITADSHLDENADTEVYKTTLFNAAGDSADFHFDLGDTFMTDKYRENYKNALNQYIAQRYYLGLNCKSSPLFFVQGNHDGEAGMRLNGREDNMTVWSNLTRKTYFPNPIPDQFYTGNTDENAFCGKIQNYYAFLWGNALFVVLDPFWYTPRSGMDNPWDRTLGKQQYEWLKKTLTTSKATFKFVFIHNLVGGADIKGKARGGSEVAGLYEWGGKNPDGTDGFKTHRPDWEMPIHQLLVKNIVTAVFHGHDHIFAKQDLDGVVYQCLSQPGAKERGNTRNGEEYGYINGTILNAPGYMRVMVASDKVAFEFVETNIHDIANNKSILFQYQIKK